MTQRWRTPAAVAAVLLLLGVGVAALVAPLLAEDDDLGTQANAAQLVSVPLAVSPLVLAVLVWWRRGAVLADSPSAEQLDHARRTLAGLVLAQWRTEAALRQLDDPAPLAVHWRLGAAGLMDQTGRLSRRRHRFHGRTDRIGELAQEFRGLARRRLVILGEPGSGKTTLAVLLVRELLEHPRQDEPVPVLLSMSGWHPAREPLREWLARRLAEDYPALRADVFGPGAPRALVAQRCILPVLDGLDEVPESVRPEIVQALNAAMGDADGIVLTCRTAEYRTVLADPGGDRLSAAAVIEPDPITPRAVAAYLADCLPPRPDGSWPRLLHRLRTGASPLAEALHTPLTLWLLRKVYLDTRRDPGHLLDPMAFPTAASVHDHLLDELTAALTGSGHRKRSWDARTAETWLGFLAHHLQRNRTRDLAWWRLRSAVPPHQLRMAAIPWTTLLFVVAYPVLLSLILELPYERLPVGALIGLAFGPVMGLAVGFAGRIRAALVGGAVALPAGLATALVMFESDDWRDSPVFGLTYISIGVLPFTVAFGLTASGSRGIAPGQVGLRLRGRFVSLLRHLLYVPVAGVLACALITPLALVADMRAGEIVVLGMLYGAPLGMMVGLLRWATRPLARDAPHTPASTLRGDIRLSYVTGAAIGLISFPSVTLVAGFFYPFWIPPLVCAALLRNASTVYLLTLIVLAGRRRVPFRLMRFLDEAHRIGLLRQVGPVYQFRHAQLQDRLAAAYAGRAASPPGETAHL
ncbi:NACHT domain-containing protein [Thermomonospora umbrina]|uniref:NACHT domain-containing protein n=1 Tax=Thermomonospora umbrina TaxID=111806 RepID=A0A3D9SRP8_9ACTN|nr:NACHT domain-containing protein [Thermomonospora umbrina]REE95284.1 NACHT domain-containing protein [Thermomonospora umbrina]